ncbi:MAG: ethanolamine ammonia-lyase subunit EutC [Deltaproteobacteria bacterium]|nr:ethanolamine ammonia-lyase subunit EutC [Deltaproteobacteria bacterium]
MSSRPPVPPPLSSPEAAAAIAPPARAAALPAAVIASPVSRDRLERWTAARVALGRAGSSLPTSVHLGFLHDHARARDAVWTAVDFDELTRRLGASGVVTAKVRSQASDRGEYLRRPDLGRLLEADAEATLSHRAGSGSARAVIVVADGLSAQAIQINSQAVIEALLPQLANAGVTVGPVVLVEQGRVAVGDPIAVALGAELAIVLIGERPGLSAADSLGCYLTWSPRPGTPDSRRNCISNIRAGGLAPAEAARKIAWLAAQALRRGVSGLALKDEAPPAQVEG